MSPRVARIKSLILVLIVLLIIGWPYMALSKNDDEYNLPGPGDILGPFSLAVPKNLSYASYLGLEQGSRFQPFKLKADLWLIEVFNVYCASCQFMRPYMNELFAKINGDAALKGRVKMIAVGAGNHQWDIKAAEKEYDFPILPDEDYAFHKMVGQPPTPFLIFARPFGQDQLLVVDTHLGRLEDSDALFAMVRRAVDRDISQMNITPGQKAVFKAKQLQAPEMPLSASQLMARVEESMTVDGREVREIEPVPLPGWDGIYTGKIAASNERVFARVVARKIPCIDCHDVFYVYSFDKNGRFIKFVPIAIYKYGNERWSDADVAKIQNRFMGQSLSTAISYRPQVDAVSSATISSEVIYHSIGDSGLVIEALIQNGLMASAGQP